MSEVLIIGGCGYSGSAIYSHLKAINIPVTSIDLGWFGSCIANNIKVDYRELTKDFMSAYSSIILLAGHSSVPMSITDRQGAFNNNVVNFVQLLKKVSPQQKLIYASSSSLYQDTGGQLANEGFGFKYPKNMYDLTKIEIDLHASLSDVQYYGLRFGTINGASTNLRVDIMVNKMIHDYKTTGQFQYSNPAVSRPILGVKDLYRAIEAIITSRSVHRGIYNLASFNATVGEIAGGVGKFLGYRPILGRPSDTYNMRICTRKFRQNFKFNFTETLKDICEDIINHYDSNNKTVRTENMNYR